MPQKTRIGERLSKVVNESTTTTTTTSEKSQKRSADEELPALNDKFHEFVKAFKPLLTALKNHHEQLEKLEKTKVQVSEELSKWITGTPVAVATNAMHVNQTLQQRDATYSEKYLNNVIEYVQEWEMVVKTRVEASGKQLKDSKTDLDHYEKKMESLTKAHDAVVARKGSTPTDKEVEKLKRNQEKLVLAKDSYECHAKKLCALLEAVVDCAWQDLIPLLLKMFQIEYDKLEGQKTMMDSSSVIENLHNLAKEYKIDVVITTTPPPASSGPAAAG